MASNDPTSLGIKFWGVRGSIPVSGPATAEFGGATTCHEILLGDTRIIVDAGSGIRRLGLQLVEERSSRANILLSHMHLDHVIGLTAFAPFFTPDFDISLHAQSNPDYPLIDALERIFNEPLFPVTLNALISRPKFSSFEAGRSIEIDGHVVRTCALNHGIGSIGYRFDHCGKSIAILTDHEHQSAEPDAALVDFAKDADLIVYDAMWDETDDYDRHKGWGHSTWQAGVALASAAKARRLACMHHAPESSDATLREREARLKAIMPGSVFARQGDEIVI
ncbi:MAG: MBL fold metallo-hydrolase [Beijerinckiaceae bacterium]|nr:MBL fold metallo-hydrolase [Beijerinckiaceae bacterium]